LRPSERIFYVDFNGNCAWNEATGDKTWGPLRALNSMLVAGNWDGNGKSEVGTFSQSQSIFYLDINGRWLSDFVIFDLCTPEQH